MRTDGSLTIGELARQTGKAASSIRYYESIGVLPEPERVGGQRRYGRDAIATIGLIDVSKRAGLTLDEIKGLLETRTDTASAVAHLRQLAVEKLPQMTMLIAETQVRQRWLNEAAECHCPSLDDCPLFDHDLDVDKVCRTGVNGEVVDSLTTEQI